MKTMDGPSILIAEDDVDDQYLLRTAFRETGFTNAFEFVENGVELINYLSARPATSPLPGLIMLDLNMPKKGGQEALKELKQHPYLKKIPVIVFTTTRNEKEINHCYELGANSYIVKPVSFDGLVHVIRNIRAYWFQVASIPKS